MRIKLFSIFILILIIPLALTACGNDDDDTPEINLTTAALNPDSPAGRGAKVFQTYCATCHVVIGDRKIVGPPLTHIATTASQRIPNMSADEYIRESILNP
ncbi:MAG TPA: c-type cytochrome, partial [Aggregatilineales bacterium]|nr:c-type cytochrome [Aggregatilineales bacterium]